MPRSAGRMCTNTRRRKSKAALPATIRTAAPIACCWCGVKAASFACNVITDFTDNWARRTAGWGSRPAASALAATLRFTDRI